MKKENVPYNEFNYDQPTDYKIWVENKELRIHQETKKEIFVQITCKKPASWGACQRLRKRPRYIYCSRKKHNSST